jgi:hypothetical protein
VGDLVALVGERGGVGERTPDAVFRGDLEVGEPVGEAVARRRGAPFQLSLIAIGSKCLLPGNLTAGVTGRPFSRTCQTCQTSGRSSTVRAAR